MMDLDEAIAACRAAMQPVKTARTADGVTTQAGGWAGPLLWEVMGAAEALLAALEPELARLRCIEVAARDAVREWTTDTDNQSAFFTTVCMDALGAALREKGQDDGTD